MKLRLIHLVRIGGRLAILLALLTLVLPLNGAVRVRALVPAGLDLPASGGQMARAFPASVALSLLPDTLPASSTDDGLQPSETPSAPVPSEPWLSARIDPPQAKPGEVVTMTARIAPDADLGAASLVGKLPRGLKPVGFSSDSAGYDPEARILSWEIAKLVAGKAVELQAYLLVEEDAPDLMILPLTLRAGEASYETRVIIKRSFLETGVTITPEGGELRSADGRVRAIFPAEVVSQGVRLAYSSLDVELLPAQQAGIAVKFALEAVTADDAAQTVRHFDKPFELRVNLAGLVNWETLPFYQRSYLAYWDEEKSQWVEILGAHREGDELIAPIDHLTIFGGGTGNQYSMGWVLLANSGNVNAFDGAFTYEYPLKLPEGRGGLAPDLALNYNSRRVDGILTWIQTDWVGLGWTLDTMEIVRKIEPRGWSPNALNVGWQNEFTLLYKGTAYKLKPFVNGNVAYGRYRAEDEQFFYIERRNDKGSNGSPNNTTGEYWIVRLRDGTEYRLGYNESSEQTIIPGDMNNGPMTNAPCLRFWDPCQTPDCIQEQCYASKVQNVLAFRWRVDQVKDLRGNRMEFLYNETAPLGLPDWERSSLLSEIRYNWDGAGYNTLIDFITATRGSDGVEDYEYADGQFPHFFAQQEYLSSIRIKNWNGSTHRTIRECSLAYTVAVSSTTYDQVRLLASIREYGLDGLAGNHSLPATTFGYVRYQNKDWSKNPQDPEWDREAFRYVRLAHLDNGYYGTVTVTYETPDTVCCGGAFNYRILTKDAYDNGVGKHKMRYTYPSSSADRAYAGDSGATYDVKYFSPGVPTAGNLIGYRTMTETLRVADSYEPVSIITHTFQLNAAGNQDHRLGRELERYTKDPSGNVLQKTATQWTAEAISATAGVYFVYPAQVDEYTRVGSGLPGTPQKKTLYYYDPTLQNGTQYGNLTGVWEYLNGALYRKTEHSFWPNTVTTTWVIDRPALDVVYDAAGAVQSKTAYHYDENSVYSAAPSRGNLVRLCKVKVLSPQTWFVAQTITYSQSFSMPVQVADGNGNVTATTYDWQYLRALTVTNPLNQATGYTYDPATWQVTKEQGPNGASTAINYEYDEWGRLTKVIRPGDDTNRPTRRIVYNDTLWPLRIDTEERVASGQDGVLRTLRFYDGLGRLLQEKVAATDSSQMIATSYTYNTQGLKEKAYIPSYQSYSTAYVTPTTGMSATLYTYDALGRTTIVTNTDNTATRTAYDGLRQVVLDARGHERLAETDPLGRTTVVTECSGSYGTPTFSPTAYAVTRYAYNPLDLLTRVTDTVGNATVISYDPLGRKTAMTDPDMGSWSYGYDNQGNLTSQTDAKNQGICFYYDALNRLKGKRLYTTACACPTPMPALSISYSYDSQANGNKGLGYRTGMSDPSGSTTWQYDARGRVVTETRTITGTVGGTFKTQWTYNARDQVTQQLYPGGNSAQTGETISTGYDKFQRPWSLNGTSAYVSSVTYDPLGRTDVLAMLNNRQIDLDYYGWEQQGGRLRYVKAGTSGAPTASQYLGYTYDAVGNPIAITDYNNASQVQTYAYDDLDRLGSAGATGGADAYGTRWYNYNTLGNPTSFEGAVYSYGSSAHKHAATQAGSNTYGYDANGNMITRNVGSSYTLSYDVENHLTGVSGPVSATFVYDGDGKRVKATVGATTTTLYIGAWYEWVSPGNTSTSYYYLGERHIALRTSSPAELSFLYLDHLGSTTNVSATTASSLQRYYPYGAQRGTNAVSTRYRFTSQPWEGGIGLYYYGARWYDPALGRFIQPDTVVPEPGNPQSLNRYSYGLNNPVKYTDASGHEPIVATVPLNVRKVDISNWPQVWRALAVTYAYLAGWDVDPSGYVLSGPTADSMNWALLGMAAPIGMELNTSSKSVLNAIKAADSLARVGVNCREGEQLVTELAQASTRNGRIPGGITLLGSYPEYVDLAKLEGFTYFDMPERVWNLLSQAGDEFVWAVNKAFLDESIAAGHSFAVTVGEDLATSAFKEPGTYLQREIQYLLEHGFEFVNGVLVRQPR